MFIGKISDKKFVYLKKLYYLCIMKTETQKNKKKGLCKIGLHKYGEWGDQDAFHFIHARRCKNCKHLHWKK